MERRSSPPFRISVVLPLNFLQFLFATNKHLFLAAFNFERAWLAPRCASTDFRLPTRVFKLGLRASRKRKSAPLRTVPMRRILDAYADPRHFAAILWIIWVRVRILTQPFSLPCFISCICQKPRGYWRLLHPLLFHLFS